MAAARQDLISTSAELCLSARRFHAVGEQFTGVASLVGDLSLSEAAERVSMAVKLARKEAAGVLRAAENAEVAAANAVAVVTSAKMAQAAAERASKRAAKAAAEAAEVARAAAAALELVMQPPGSAGDKRAHGVGGKGTKEQGGGSSSRGPTTRGSVSVAVKINDQCASNDEEKAHGATPDTDQGTLMSSETAREKGNGAGNHKRGNDEATDERRETEVEKGQDGDVEAAEDQEKAKAKGRRNPRGENKPRRRHTSRDPLTTDRLQMRAFKRQRRLVSALAAGNESLDGGGALARRSEPERSGKQKDPSVCHHSDCNRRRAYGLTSAKTAKFCSSHTFDLIMNL